MSTSNLYIIIYILLWALTFFYYWKKKKVFGAGNFILASYLAYSIISLLLYNHNQVVNPYGELDLFPFLYLYIMMFVFLRPVLCYDESCEIQIPSTFLIKFFSYTYIFSALIVIPILIGDIKDGIIMILTNPEGGDDLYQEFHLGSTKNSGWSLYNPIKTIFNFFSDFGVLLFFLYINLPYKKRIVTMGMGFALFITLIGGLAGGQRTGLTMKFLMIIGAYFLFRPHLPSRVNKTIMILGCLLTTMVAFFIIAINVSRFSNRSYDSSYQLINYAGQASLFFNKYGLDAGGIRNGDRTFNHFKRWLGFENVPKDVDETRHKYRKMKLDDSRYTTYVGDFTLDFGPTGAAFILCTFSLLFLNLTRCKDNKISFHQLIIVFFVMTITVQGGMYLFYYSFQRNFNILYFIILYFVFKWDYKRHIDSLEYLK